MDLAPFHLNYRPEDSGRSPEAIHIKKTSVPGSLDLLIAKVGLRLGRRPRFENTGNWRFTIDQKWDKPLLETIRDFLGCGRVSRRKEREHMYRLVVTSGRQNVIEHCDMRYAPSTFHKVQ